jgi:hypothetical protein
LSPDFHRYIFKAIKSNSWRIQLCKF